MSCGLVGGPAIGLAGAAPRGGDPSPEACQPAPAIPEGPVNAGFAAEAGCTCRDSQRDRLELEEDGGETPTIIARPARIGPQRISDSMERSGYTWNRVGTRGVEGAQSPPFAFSPTHQRNPIAWIVPWAMPAVSKRRSKPASQRAAKGFSMSTPPKR